MVLIFLGGGERVALYYRNGMRGNRPVPMAAAAAGDCHSHGQNHEHKEGDYK